MLEIAGETFEERRGKESVKTEEKIGEKTEEKKK